MFCRQPRRIGYSRGRMRTEVRAKTKSPNATTFIPMRAPRIFEALGDCYKEQDRRKKDGVAYVLVGRISGKVPSSNMADAWLLSAVASAKEGLWYCGIMPGPAGAFGFVNGSVFNQALKAVRVVRGEAADVLGLELGVVGGVRLEPGIEIPHVRREFLAAISGGGVSLETVGGRLTVEKGLAAVPLGGLVAAPGGRHRHDRQNKDLDDFHKRFPTFVMLGGLFVLMFTKLVCDLHVHTLGHP